LIKDYGYLLREDQSLRGADAASESPRSRRTSPSIVATLGARTIARGTDDVTVAYHSACSLQHGQKITGNFRKNCFPRMDSW
jgi:glycolate oxidase iron-sulfur subunit